MLNFPTNPTGATIPLAELEGIAELCRRHGIIVLSDEIYSDLTYDGAAHHSIAALPGMKERTIFLHGFSKAFAMTGFRIGYACGPAELIDAMMRIHQYGILCASITSQEAACEALRNGAPQVETMRREYDARRNFISSALTNLGLQCPRPKGAFYVFPDIRASGLTSAEFSLRLLKEKKVAVVPGTAFGPSGEGHVRCSYATSLPQIKTAMRLMGEFCAELGVKGATGGK